MNNNQDNFVYNQQPSPDNQLNNISNINNQQPINMNANLHDTNQQLNIIPQQQNINNFNNINNINIENQKNNQTPNDITNAQSNSENINVINQDNNTIQNISDNINNLNNEFNNQNNNNVNNIYNNISQSDNNQDNNKFNFNGVFSNQTTSIKDNMSDEDYNLINPEQNSKFIKSTFDTTSTTLADLNVDPNAPRIDYSNDKKVQENIVNEEKRKNTIAISQEAKVFLTIIVVLLIFIFVMPYIFDAIKNIG